MHGDAVNSAARIEAINKTTGTNILISASTAAQLQNVQIRSIGTFDIRGKSNQTELFTVEPDALQITEAGGQRTIDPSSVV